MKKKIGAIVMAGVMATTVAASLAFTGCGTKIYDFNMPEGGYDGRDVSITFANTTGQTLEKIINPAIERFNELYPNIKVTVDNTTKDWDDFAKKITTQLSGGKQPNVAFCYPDHVALYNQSNAVLPLNDYFLPGSDFDDMTVTNAKGETEPLGLTADQLDETKGGYISAFYKEGSIYGDGNTYTLPFAKSTEVMFYNKTFFKDNNLTVPTTWAEMEAVCAKITALDENCIALGYDSESNLFITMCEQLGSDYTSLEGDHYLFDNAENRAFVKKLKTWYDSRYLTTKNTYGKYSSNLFKEKKCYMSIGSTGGSSYQDPGSTDGQMSFEVGVAPIPQEHPEKPKTILQGPSVCIFKHEDPYEVLASWLLIKFLTTDVQFQGLYSENSGYAPVTMATYESDAYQEFLDEASGDSKGLTAQTSQICKELAGKKDVFYYSPAFVGSSKAREQVGILLKTYLQSESNLDAALDDAFSKALQECRFFSGR